MRLLLWDLDDRRYSFEIDVSLDQQFWTPLVRAYELRLVLKTKNKFFNTKNLILYLQFWICRSWQSMRFKNSIPVVFIRIVGTFNSANEVFHLVHFECPAKPETPFNKIDFDAATDELPLVCGVQRMSLAASSTNDEEEEQAAE